MTDSERRNIEATIEEFRNGKVVIVTDDEHRENEGDFIAAAELTTPDIINFMSKEGRGLICAALTEERCTELKLNLMVQNNTALNSTNFTISVDLLGHGCSTGISAHDRARTINALAGEDSRPEDFGRPGHIFPIQAHPEGLLVRPGHTEATIELAKLAGLKPAGVLVEIMNPDGSMARYPDLVKLSEKLGVKLITIKHLTEYLKTVNS
ncbi:3,4-dihydroxy-2-butanone-4-phosphate synthase [Saccharicrinis sp. FJH54]|uniref:3,4-dihydroxy-2-butanone-4-phosphate synthase n=1 Tax=Saccharicrinis sp. FJH54 TaxID=3344665 RepID=UPI0035D4FB43